jgi:hypothetical protein
MHDRVKSLKIRRSKIADVTPDIRYLRYRPGRRKIGAIK